MDDVREWWERQLDLKNREPSHVESVADTIDFEPLYLVDGGVHEKLMVVTERQKHGIVFPASPIEERQAEYTRARREHRIVFPVAHYASQIEEFQPIDPALWDKHRDGLKTWKLGPD